MDGNPPAAASVVWKKEGSPDEDFTELVRSLALESVLTLPPATTATAGSYVCVANNGIPTAAPAEDKKTTFVKVNHAPMIDAAVTKAKVACDKEEESTCGLECGVRGWPKVTLTWLRSGRLILKEDEGFEVVSEDKEDDADPVSWSSKLSVKRVTSEEFGNYTCKASNVYGEAAATISLEVSGEPDPPATFRAVSSTHSAILLRLDMQN